MDVAGVTTTASFDRRTRPRPFLKWAGGKTQLLEQYARLLPTTYRRYYEAFVGGGALFFALRPREAQLSDVNEELIDCYRGIRDDVDSVITALRTHRYDRDHFYSERARDPSELGLAERAARTIFLNKTAFNGLYRVNSRGLFNVPFGRHRNPNICDEPNLRACAAALQEVDLAAGDFEQCLADARAGDFVYLDPPYVPLSDTSYFTSYSRDGFVWPKQRRLANVFAELAQRGVQVMLSNSDVPELRALFGGFVIDSVRATRRISRDAAGRGEIGELVVRSYR